MLEKWEQNYWEKVKAETKPFPETESVLEKLDGKYQMALITNTQGQKTNHKHRISLFPKIERYFKYVFVAGESGIPAKPDPTSFQMCLNKLGIAAKEAVYVGDDWHKDLCGAENAGIQPIWLQHHSVNRNWPNVELSVPVITSLKELLELEKIL